MYQTHGFKQLYVPLRPPQGTATRELELRILSDGRIGLTAYTTLASLIDNCGDGQPWGLLDERDLVDVTASAYVDVVLLDAELPEADKTFRDQGPAPSSYLVDPVR